MRAARAELDTVDSELTALEEAAKEPQWFPDWSAERRNGVVYLVCTVPVLLVGLGVSVFSEPLFGALCLLTGCVLSFGVGWLACGILFRPPAGGEVKRTAKLGLAINTLPLLLACFWGVLSYFFGP